MYTHLVCIVCKEMSRYFVRNDLSNLNDERDEDVIFISTAYGIKTRLFLGLAAFPFPSSVTFLGY